MGKQSTPPTGKNSGRSRRTSTWAIVAAAGILLIYVLNGVFMPVADPEVAAEWATATAQAELAGAVQDGTPALAEEVAEAENQADAPAASEDESATAEDASAEVTAEDAGEENVAAGESVEVAAAIPAEAATDEHAEESAEQPAETPTEAPTEAPTDTPTDTPTATNTPRPTNTPTPQPTRLPARINGLPTILYEDLPPQAHDTIELIDSGGPFPFDRDGITFQNREGLLPQEPRGYYREYTVITPGERDRGARRIVEGEDGELYYTDDHYESFSYVVR